MSLKIPKSHKKEFQKGIKEYIKVMGRDITVALPPITTDCPNCLYNTVSEKSTNTFDLDFIRPVNIFPGKTFQKTIYPQPFNVLDSEVDPATQYDPSLVNPKILTSTVCPVCRGEGKLTEENTVCIQAHITWNPREEYLDLSGGRDGVPICRVKANKEDYALCRDAVYFIVDGTKCILETPPKTKGLGDTHLIEFYVVQVTVDDSVTIKYDGDPRINSDTVGQSSDQADVGNPTVPPSIPSDDGAW